MSTNLPGALRLTAAHTSGTGLPEPRYLRLALMGHIDGRGHLNGQVAERITGPAALPAALDAWTIGFYCQQAKDVDFTGG